MILVVDDDPILKKIIGRHLHQEVQGYPTASDALRDNLVGVQSIFIDNFLDGDEQGIEFIGKFKAKYQYAPIFFMTSSLDEKYLSRAFVKGVVDFIRKPIVPAELVARYHARMTEASIIRGQQILEIGDIKIFCETGKITGPLGEIYVSSSEMRLLKRLIGSTETTVNKGDLMEFVWEGLKVSDNALTKKIQKLRGNLGQCTENVVVKTVHGEGFLLKIKAPGAMPARSSEVVGARS